MYEVKVKLKLSKKERKHLEERILLQLSKHDMVIEPSESDKISLSYISNEMSFSSAVSVVSESFVKTAFSTIFEPGILTMEKNKIDEISIREIKKPDTENYVDIISNNHGVVNIKYGNLKFSKKISF